MRILFVCLGNICRSPTAEGVLRHLLEAELAEGEEPALAAVEVESAGTGDWHIGHPPDERATEAAARRGIEVAGAARRVGAGDFEAFDLIVAMDRQNLADLRSLAPASGHHRKLVLLRDFDPAAATEPDVPDPYYGGPDGFEHVLDVVEASCRGLIERIRAGGI